MHDIALLQLSESLTFNPFIRSICLSSNKDFVQVGDRTLVTGWGETQGSGNFSIFTVKLKFLFNHMMNVDYKNTSWSTTLCAGLCKNSTCDACQVGFKIK